ncbi:hypothetical protein ACQB6R_05530 [Propionibacteriaceae bacterium G1746]
MPVTITYPGGSFTGCSCLQEWWPLVNAMALKRGLINETLDVSQGSFSGGAVTASAGTHDGGGVLDLRQFSDKVITLLREAGSAAWHRTPAQSAAFPHHTHLVLVGCPHLASGAADQVDSYKRGRNGLASDGPDDGPRVNPLRSWSEGADWCHEQLGGITPTNISPQEPDMNQETFDLLMLNALKNPAIKDALAVAANGATYGRDLDQDGKTDTLGQMVAHMSDDLAKLAMKLGL